jgi:magnesium-transporting ATPase (P-type)
MEVSLLKTKSIKIENFRGRKNSKINLKNYKRSSQLTSTKRQFIYLYIAIIISLLVLVLLFCKFLNITQPHFVYALESISVPYTNVYLSYVGFIVPLFVSIISFYTYSVGYDKIQPKSLYLFILTISLIGLLLYFIPSLQDVTKGVGSHVNPIIFIPTLIFWVYLLLKNDEAALLLSYPSFFLMCAISDVDSLSIFHRVVFGGAFLYDGDFLFPLLFFVLSYWIWLLVQIKIIKRSSTMVP